MWVFGGGFSLIKHLRNYFFTGLLVLLPLTITLKLLFWGFEKVDSILGNLIFYNLHKYFGLDVKITGLGLAALLVIITLTGIFARNYLGRKLIEFGENLLERIPVLNTIYSITKQFTQGVALSQTEKGAFRKMVMVEYPRQGIYSPGFLTGEAFAEVEEKTGVKCLSVFIPTPPNPTTGFLILVPEDKVTILNMSVEEGFKLIVSVGVITPDRKSKD
jgi:uncharacterized membrane protein